MVIFDSYCQLLKKIMDIFAETYPPVYRSSFVEDF